MILNGFECVNEEKIDRAINGTIGKDGALHDGAGLEASEEVKLAKYDRLGGLILLNGRHVKTGSFWDIKKKVVRDTPEVILVMNDLEGNVVEIPADEALSPELLAKEAIDKKKKASKMAELAEREATKAEKKQKKSKKVDEDEE